MWRNIKNRTVKNNNRVNQNSIPQSVSSPLPVPPLTQNNTQPASQHDEKFYTFLKFIQILIAEIVKISKINPTTHEQVKSLIASTVFNTYNTLSLRTTLNIVSEHFGVLIDDVNITFTNNEQIYSCFSYLILCLFNFFCENCKNITNTTEIILDKKKKDYAWNVYISTLLRKLYQTPTDINTIINNIRKNGFVSIDVNFNTSEFTPPPPSSSPDPALQPVLPTIPQLDDQFPSQPDVHSSTIDTDASGLVQTLPLPPLSSLPNDGPIDPTQTLPILPPSQLNVPSTFIDPEKFGMFVDLKDKFINEIVISDATILDKNRFHTHINGVIAKNSKIMQFSFNSISDKNKIFVDERKNRFTDDTIYACIVELTLSLFKIFCTDNDCNILADEISDDLIKSKFGSNHNTNFIKQSNHKMSNILKRIYKHMDAMVNKIIRSYDNPPSTTIDTTAPGLVQTLPLPSSTVGVMNEEVVPQQNQLNVPPVPPADLDNTPSDSVSAHSDNLNSVPNLNAPPDPSQLALPNNMNKEQFDVFLGLVDRYISLIIFEYKKENTSFEVFHDSIAKVVLKNRSYLVNVVNNNMSNINFDLDKKNKNKFNDDAIRSCIEVLIVKLFDIFCPNCVIASDETKLSDKDLDVHNPAALRIEMSNFLKRAYRDKNTLNDAVGAIIFQYDKDNLQPIPDVSQTQESSSQPLPIPLQLSQNNIVDQPNDSEKKFRAFEDLVNKLIDQIVSLVLKKKLKNVDESQIRNRINPAITPPTEKLKYILNNIFVDNTNIFNENKNTFTDATIKTYVKATIPLLLSFFCPQCNITDSESQYDEPFFKEFTTQKIDNAISNVLKHIYQHDTIFKGIVTDIIQSYQKPQPISQTQNDMYNYLDNLKTNIDTAFTSNPNEHDQSVLSTPIDDLNNSDSDDQSVPSNNPIDKNLYIDLSDIDKFKKFVKTSINAIVRIAKGKLFPNIYIKDYYDHMVKLAIVNDLIKIQVLYQTITDAFNNNRNTNYMFDKTQVHVFIDTFIRDYLFHIFCENCDIKNEVAEINVYAAANREELMNNKISKFLRDIALSPDLIKFVATEVLKNYPNKVDNSMFDKQKNTNGPITTTVYAPNLENLNRCVITFAFGTTGKLLVETIEFIDAKTKQSTPFIPQHPIPLFNKDDDTMIIDQATTALFSQLPNLKIKLDNIQNQSSFLSDPSDHFNFQKGKGKTKKRNIKIKGQRHSKKNASRLPRSRKNLNKNL
jgi:hypothetical protein